MILCFSNSALSASGSVFENKLVEEGACESQIQILGEVMRLGKILLGEFAQAFLAVHGHEHRRHQSDQRLIRADVRRRLFAPDVLLARRQSQAEGAIAMCILGFAHDAPRQLTNKLLFCRDHTGKRTTVARRNRERLQFARDDIRIPRRLEQSQRNSFRERHDQQRAMLVRQFGGCFDIFHDAEEVWRLNDDSGRILVRASNPDLRDRAIPHRRDNRILRPASLDAGSTSAAPRDIRGGRSATTSTRLRPVTRTAIIAASGTADDPSYIDAFATSMPVNWQSID